MHNNNFVRSLAPLLGVVLFGFALWALHHSLKEYRYSDIIAAFRMIPLSSVLPAFALTALSYFTLSAYDFLAFKYIDQRIAYWRVFVTGFVGYALSNNIGYSILSGGSVRYRFYTQWGVNAVNIARLIAFCTATGLLGISTVAGAAIFFKPEALPAIPVIGNEHVRWLGFLFWLFPAGYFAAAVLRREPITIRKWTISLPRPQFALMQLALGSLDYALASSVLYVLLPVHHTISYFSFVGYFMIAMVGGLLSHVPGGIGVFESLMVYQLDPVVPANEALGALLCFRVIYYLTPLSIAAVVAIAHEIIVRRERFWRVTDSAAAWFGPITPQALGVVTLASSVLLLISSSTPSLLGRMMSLERVVPLGVIEVSHFLASITGVSLLLLSRALQRRIRGAYAAALGLLFLGAVLALLKGFDYEVAIVLLIVALVLLPFSKQFYRKASLLEPRLTPAWIATISIVLLCMVWLGLFSFRRVGFSPGLFWHFSVFGDAPRFVRGSLGVLAVLGAFSVAKFLRTPPVNLTHPGAAALQTVEDIVTASPEAYARLALTGHKSILFNDTQDAFVMYRAQGESWIALGDPVGPDTEKMGLIWRYLEMCERHGSWAVFYQVSPATLPLYVDAGLTLQQLGEEARVRLGDYAASVEQAQLLSSHDADGYTFDVVNLQDQQHAAVMPELRRISDSWLHARGLAERHFVFAPFREDFVRRFPCALLHRNGTVIGFATLWPGAQQYELGIGLLRLGEGQADGVLDYFLLRVLFWGKEQGYAWLNLGMSPARGEAAQTDAPTPGKIGELISWHGEHFPGWQDMRGHKDKLHPVWEAKYLASPGGIHLPVILGNISELITHGANEVKGSTT